MPLALNDALRRRDAARCITGQAKWLRRRVEREGEPEKKAAKVQLALVPVAGCSLNHDGRVTPCTEHKTYPSDPHCRTRGRENHIAECDVHELQKGGKVVVIAQPVQQPQGRATRRTRYRYPYG